MSYLRKDVYEKTIKYFNGDELATNVWINKYALKDSEGNIYEQTPDDMHKRIAKELARVEKNYKNPLTEDQIYNDIKDFKYIVPQGSPMAGIGNDYQISSLSNCFVVGPQIDKIGKQEDSYGSILRTDQEIIQLCKRRAGVGTTLEHVRPNGSSVKNAAMTSTGVVPFMERYSNSIREVAQAGRRGALMLSTHVKSMDSKNFINAKLDTKKVTGANISVKIDDDFMDALENGKKYKQQFPIESDNPEQIQEIDPKEIWDKLIYNNWKSAEPGILFWSTIERESVPDSYSDMGFKSIGTNPCVVGDTKVAVADGRNYVSIKQLSEEGKDVPVYSINNDGELCIRTMRNPRITGYNEKIYKIKIEGEHVMRVNGNHQFRLKDGSYKEAKNLSKGDSLHIMTKWEASFDDIFKSNSKSSDYYWLNNGKFGKHKSEHRMIYEELTGNKIEKSYVIHHKDFNSKNNSIDNLELMSKKEHDKYHSERIKGGKNPYHRMSSDWKFNFASHPGKLNPNYSGISNEKIIEEFKILTNKLERRISNKDWQSYAKEKNLPQNLSKFRDLGNVILLAKKVALELGYDNINADPRLVKTYKEALKNGYNAEILENEVLVNKICEYCGEEFKINYFRREVSFCSNECALNYVNNNDDFKEKRSRNINKTYEDKAKINKEKQIKIYSDLKFKFDRNPKLSEWENECKKNNIPHRLRTKYGFKNFKEISENSEMYNHKVISVVEDGFENVYNGTVDEFHNYFTGGFEEYTKQGKKKYINLNQLNCGEIILCDGDSCRLLLLNLFNFVKNPFTKEAYFDFELFKKYISRAQRYMDDIVDLEIEQINKILDKINNDPETENTKFYEKDLWERILDKCKRGRRTGTGVTGEGDMLAALNLKYGEKEAIDFSEKVHQTLALNAYKESVNLAKERGSFEIFNFEKEKDNIFLNRLFELDSSLKDDMIKYGRRNIGILTISPAGSVSILTQTTSGIEPVYMPYYKRRRKINPNDKDSRVDYIDEMGDHWEEYIVFHPKFVDWAKTKGYEINEKLSDEDLEKIFLESPYYKACSNDINWLNSVEMQGKIQKYVDHSISKTINLPKDTTIELVDEIYRKAHKYGCKGITIYRDGSRSGVLVSDKGKKKQDTKAVNDLIKNMNAPKRPKELECDILRFTNKGEKWIGFIGLYEGEPYEVFTGIQESFTIPNYVEKGKIRKVKTDNEKRYDFVYIDNGGYEQEVKALSRAFNKEYWDYAKMISAVLRHYMPVPSVINLLDSLHIDGDLIGTWKAGVKRMLKKYIKEDIKSKNKCPECGQETLTIQEGCMTCKNCGWSKCG